MIKELLKAEHENIKLKPKKYIKFFILLGFSLYFLSSYVDIHNDLNQNYIEYSLSQSYTEREVTFRGEPIKADSELYNTQFYRLIQNKIDYGLLFVFSLILCLSSIKELEKPIL